MGSKYTIIKSVWNGDPQHPEYAEVELWRGQSFVAAVWNLFTHKVDGECVSLQCR